MAVDHVLIVLVGDAAAVVPQLAGLDLPPIDWRDVHGRPMDAPVGDPAGEDEEDER